jgi:hypothetical protein
MKRRGFLKGLLGGIIGGPAVIEASENFEKPVEDSIWDKPIKSIPKPETILCSGAILGGSGIPFIYGGASNITFNSFGPTEGCNTKL